MSIGNIVKGLAAPAALIVCVCLTSSAQAQTEKGADQLKCEQAGGRWTVDSSPPVIEAAQASGGVLAPRDAASGQASGKKMTAATQASEAGSVSYRAAPVSAGDLDGDGLPDVAATCSLAIKTKGTSAK
ncbi:MAG: hypothetical protein ACM3W4_01440 [Ignavibacteriales bacterium]